MIRCAKCDNDTRTSNLVTPAGEVLVSGTLGTAAQPIVAQVCSACGYIELYAPLPLGQSQTTASEEQLVPLDSPAEMPVPAA
jgi:predicted nucleic-acid-binding Zn-ribbon protein